MRKLADDDGTLTPQWASSPSVKSCPLDLDPVNQTYHLNWKGTVRYDPSGSL
jgi:hypothetical protein